MKMQDFLNECYETQTRWNWRWGQTLFNMFYRHFAQKANAIMDTDFDPFYNDDRANAFLDHVKQFFEDESGEKNTNDMMAKLESGMTIKFNGDKSECISEKDAIKENVIKLVKHHRKHCEGQSCDICLHLVKRCLDLAGIELTEEEKPIFF